MAHDDDTERAAIGQPRATTAQGSIVRLVVMGVASSGKSTVAWALADHLHATFLDADDFHDAGNVAKMAAGTPLTDDDRSGWLATLRDELRRRRRVVLACSALRRSYRDVLRSVGDVQFVFLDLDEDTASARAALRSGHFMGAGMVAGQFATLEPPADDETDVVTVDATQPIDHVVATVTSGSWNQM